MLKFYFSWTSSSTKLVLFLEESGIPYEPVPIDLQRGAQHKPEYLAINPNGKTPAIDDDGVIMFDSSAILIYLADKHDKFLPPKDNPQNRASMLSWVIFAGSGIGPFSGQAAHFKYFAPEPGQGYAHERYQYEARRHYGVVNKHLAGREYMVADTYSIADMAIWSYGQMAPMIAGEDAWSEFPHLKRLIDTIDARPAAARVLAVKERFASAFSPPDEESRKHLYKHVRADA